MTIRSPAEWGVDQFRSAGIALDSFSRVWRSEADVQPPIVTVRRITAADLSDVLRNGWADFGANRTDIIFLCVLYPVIGIVLAYAAPGRDLLPLIFPLASGFALVAPFAALGLYEMSRRRELGVAVGWTDVFRVLSAPSLGAIVWLGLLLTAIFLIWLLVAYAIYRVTLGPLPPASAISFMHDVLTMAAGWTMIVAGVGLGFMFAALVFCLSVVGFPLLLDREARLETAVAVSVRTVLANPGPMALWALIVTGSLVIGSLPLFVGLAIALPLLGHSTWHLYRKAVVWQEPPVASTPSPGSAFSAPTRSERQG